MWLWKDSKYCYEWPGFWKLKGAVDEQSVHMSKSLFQLIPGNLYIFPKM